MIFTCCVSTMLSRTPSLPQFGRFWVQLGVHRTFTSSPVYSKKAPSRIKITEHDYTKKFLKGSGPGGQKINKTSSAVQLTHIATGIVVKCQGSRSRTLNLREAEKTLADRVDEHLNGDNSRTARVAMEKGKKKARAMRKSKKKYRALEDAKKGQEEGEKLEEEAEDEEDGVGGVIGDDNGRNGDSANDSSASPNQERSKGE